MNARNFCYKSTIGTYRAVCKHDIHFVKYTKQKKGSKRIERTIQLYQEKR